MPAKKNNRRSTKAEKEVIREVDADLSPEEAGAPPVGRSITVEKRIYSRPLTPDEAPEVDATNGIHDGAELAGFDEYADMTDTLSSDLLSFFDAEGNDGEHRLRVYQMIQPSRGVRFTKGSTVYRGQIPYTENFLQDVQEQFGGGVFRLQVVGTWEDPETGRHKFGIIKSRTVTIAAPLRLYVPDDPTSPHQPAPAMLGQAPQVPYLLQPPAGSEPAPTPREQLTDLVAMVRLVDQLRPPQPTAPPPDPEVAAMTLIARNPETMEKIGAGLAKNLLGGAAASDGDDWAGVVKALITSGQGPEMLRVIIQEFMAPFKSNGGQNIHTQPQAQAGQTQEQTNMQYMPASAPGAPMEAPPHPGQGPGQPPQQPQQQPMPAPDPHALPEDQALTLMIQFCARRVPPSFAAERLISYADLINNQAPQYSIDMYLDAFIEMTPEDALAFVTSQRGGEVVASLPHALAWTSELQAIIKRQSSPVGDSQQ